MTIVPALSYAGAADGDRGFRGTLIPGGGSPVGMPPMIASPVAAVPEPGVWASLITGFSLTGIVMRRRRSPPTPRR